jgi:hypothetical protein
MSAATPSAGGGSRRRLVITGQSRRWRKRQLRLPPTAASMVLGDVGGLQNVLEASGFVHLVHVRNELPKEFLPSQEIRIGLGF